MTLNLSNKDLYLLQRALYCIEHDTSVWTDKDKARAKALSLKVLVALNSKGGCNA